MKRRDFETVTEALNDLRARGYSADFNLLLEKDCLVCHSHKVELSPDDFEIDEVYRFYSSSDPGDEMIVYAISSTHHQLKGVIVNAFGLYSESAVSKLVSKLELHGKKD
jgi:hypothetical protein